MNIVKKLILIIVVSISCVGCDQVTKSIAKSVLSQSATLSYLDDTVRLQIFHNQGAFLSLGASLPEAWRHGLFSVSVGVMLLSIFAYAVLSKSVYRPSVVLALALFFAGGVGNLIDRVIYDGYVIDFLNVGIGSLRTGIFNVADIAISIGAFIFVVASIRERQHVR